MATNSQLLEWRPTGAQKVDHFLSQAHGLPFEPTPFNDQGDLTLPDLTPFQCEFIEELHDPDGEKVIGVWGGIGCGKSIGLAIGAYTLAMSRPGAVILMSSDTHTNLMAITYRDCKAIFGDEARWIGKPISEFQFKNGSIVMLRAYKMAKEQDEAQNPWEGRTVTAALFIDEAQKLSPMSAVHALERTRGVSRDELGDVYEPKVIINGRPGAIDWWVKVVEDEMGGRLFRPWTEDNPHNGPGYMRNLRRKLSPAEFLCKTRGHPMPVTNAVYSIFSDRAWPRGNILQDFELDHAAPISIGVDFGRRCPSVVFFQTVRRWLNRGDVLIIEEPDDEGVMRPRELVVEERMQVDLDVIFDECQPDEVSTPQLIAAIRATGYRIQLAAADPAGNAKNEHTGARSIELLGRPANFQGTDGLGGGLGCPVIYTNDPARTFIDSGIEVVCARICNADGLRCLVTTPQLWAKGQAASPARRNLYKSLMQYSWDDVQTKRHGGTISKDRSHTVDALRYWVINRRWPADQGGDFVAPTITSVGKARAAWLKSER